MSAIANNDCCRTVFLGARQAPRTGSLLLHRRVAPTATAGSPISTRKAGWASCSRQSRCQPGAV